MSFPSYDYVHLEFNARSSYQFEPGPESKKACKSRLQIGKGPTSFFSAVCRVGLSKILLSFAAFAKKCGRSKRILRSVFQEIFSERQSKKGKANVDKISELRPLSGLPLSQRSHEKLEFPLSARKRKILFDLPLS